jgi:hypothetical protein
MIARREGRHQRELARLAGEVRDVAETLKRIAAETAWKHAGGANDPA